MNDMQLCWQNVVARRCSLKPYKYLVNLNLVLISQSTHYKSRLCIFSKLVQFGILSNSRICPFGILSISGICTLEIWSYLELCPFGILPNLRLCPFWDFVLSGYCPIWDFIHSGSCQIRNFVFRNFVRRIRVNEHNQKVVNSVFKDYKPVFINGGAYRDISIQIRPLFADFRPVKFRSCDRTPPNLVPIKPS